jgi:hypothetical protein
LSTYVVVFVIAGVTAVPNPEYITARISPEEGSTVHTAALLADQAKAEALPAVTVVGDAVNESIDGLGTVPVCVTGA